MGYFRQGLLTDLHNPFNGLWINHPFVDLLTKSSRPLVRCTVTAEDAAITFPSLCILVQKVLTAGSRVDYKHVSMLGDSNLGHRGSIPGLFPLPVLSFLEGDLSN